jgi:P27 family predicted phage terminase small subunit
MSETNIIRLEDYASSSTNNAPPDLLPECPDYLTDKAKKHWAEIAPSLGNRGIVNELDRDVLGIYCSLLARFIELDNQLEIVGMTQMTKTGYEAETGTFTAWNKLLKPIMNYAKQLGLTPPARIAMHAINPGQGELDF